VSGSETKSMSAANSSKRAMVCCTPRSNCRTLPLSSGLLAMGFNHPLLLPLAGAVLLLCPPLHSAAKWESSCVVLTCAKRAAFGVKGVSRMARRFARVSLGAAGAGAGAGLAGVEDEAVGGASVAAVEAATADDGDVDEGAGVVAAVAAAAGAGAAAAAGAAVEPSFASELELDPEEDIVTGKHTTSVHMHEHGLKSSAPFVRLLVLRAPLPVLCACSLVVLPGRWLHRSLWVPSLCQLTLNWWCLRRHLQLL
jgi:hypothetical protein